MQTSPMAREKPAGELTGLGVALTTILFAAFFGFIGFSAFSPATMARPIVVGGIVTWAFACGLGVIGLGVALTGLYALVADRAEARRATASGL